MIWQGSNLRGLCVAAGFPAHVRRSIYMSSRGTRRGAPAGASAGESLVQQFEKLDLSLPSGPPQTHTQTQTLKRAGRRRRRVSSAKVEQMELDRRLVQMERFTSALKKEIEAKDEKTLQQARLEEAEMSSADTDKAVDEVMEFMELGEGKPGTSIAEIKASLFELPGETSKLPVSLTSRLGNSTVTQYIANTKNPDWKGLVVRIHKEKGLTGVTEEEFSKLVYAVPLDQRADVLPLLHEMAWDAKIPLSKHVYDNTMAGYAQRGDTRTVQAFMDQMKADSLVPDAFSYGNLLKSLGKNNDLKASVQVLRQIQSEGVAPSLPLYTTLLQTCIRVNDYTQAFEVFDMLKFLGTDIHPDRAVYNSVIYAAAKTHNVERVNDLYREMTNQGILPDADTYSTLIYGFARTERTHVRAWELLLEMYDRGIPPSRKTLNSMLYLCGSTGELSFARAIFRQLCTTSESYPDAFSFNCLLTAYANYKPGFFSPVLSTAVGPKLRAAFFYNMDIPATTEPDITPPFLPAAMLLNVPQVLAESRAVFTFFKNMALSPPASLATYKPLVNPHTVLSYLKIPCQLTHEAEFRYRWTTETCVAHVSNPVDNKPDTRTPRNHYMYTLAIQAYAQHKWSHAHAKGLWESRGEWRRNPASVYRTSMTPSQRASSDFIFAQHMAAYLAQVNLLDDAVDIVRSTAKQFTWRKGHLTPLLEVATRIEDTKSLRLLNGIIAAYYKRD